MVHRECIRYLQGWKQSRAKSGFDGIHRLESTTVDVLKALWKQHSIDGPYSKLKKPDLIARLEEHFNQYVFLKFSTKHNVIHVI